MFDKQMAAQSPGVAGVVGITAGQEQQVVSGRAKASSQPGSQQAEQRDKERKKERLADWKREKPVEWIFLSLRLR